MNGTWRISFSMESIVNNGDNNYAYLYHNGEQMPETEHDRGREILMTAQQGDTLTLRSGRVDYRFYNIITCFEYIAV